MRSSQFCGTAAGVTSFTRPHRGLIDMIAVGQYVHAVFPGGLVFFVRVEEINYERSAIWTGKVWMPMRNCVEIPIW